MSEKEPTQTRSYAEYSSMRRHNGVTAPAALMSILNRALGRASKSSRSSGIGSRPPIRTLRTVAQGSVAIAPRVSETRSRWSSWKATTSPSLVAWTSVSRWVKPRSTAVRKAVSEFSSPTFGG